MPGPGLFETNALSVINKTKEAARKYLQLLIVEMEMQQIAESIICVKKRIAKHKACKLLQPFFVEATKNRPGILKRKRLQKCELEDYIYLLQFDPMIFLDDLWVDG